MLRVTFPYGEIGRDTGVIIGLRDRDDAFRGTEDRTLTDARINWTYADSAANDSQERDRRVDLAVAKQFAARARQEAVRLNKAGDYEGAQRALEATARRIRAYASGEPELRRIVDELKSEAERFAAPLPAMSLKEAHYASSNMSRMRMASGQANLAVRPSRRDGEEGEKWPPRRWGHVLSLREWSRRTNCRSRQIRDTVGCRITAARCGRLIG